MLKHATRMLTKLSPVFKSIRTTPCFTFSSKIYEDLRSLPYRQMAFKSSNLRYNSKDMSLLTYFYHPSIEISLLVPNIPSTQFYSIQRSSVLLLNFLQESSEELAQSAWENRKTFSINFRDTLRLAKIVPNSKATETFTYEFTTQPEGGLITKLLSVTDRPQHSQIFFSLRQKQGNGEIAWQSSLSISYEDHPTFLQSIRNNTLYITGLKYQLELSKEESLIHASNAIVNMSRPIISTPAVKSKKKQSV